MKHLLSSLRHAWVDCAPGCWQQIRNMWVETPVNSVPWNQSSSSGSKEFLDHIGKQINTELLSCRGDRRGRELPAACCFSAGKVALRFWCPDYAVLASLKGPEDHIAPVLLIIDQSPDSKKSLRAVVPKSKSYPPFWFWGLFGTWAEPCQVWQAVVWRSWVWVLASQPCWKQSTWTKTHPGMRVVSPPRDSWQHLETFSLITEERGVLLAS